MARWTAGWAVFRLDVDEGGKLASFTHILGNEAKVPGRFVIAKACIMFDNHMSHVARKEMKPNSHTFGYFEFEGIHEDFRCVLSIPGKPVKRCTEIAITARGMVRNQADLRRATVAQEKTTATEPAVRKRAADAHLEGSEAFEVESFGRAREEVHVVGSRSRFT